MYICNFNSKHMFLLTEKIRLSLSELFEIKQGVALSSKKEIEKSVGQHTYKVVYVSDLGNPYHLLDFDELTDYAIDTKIKEEKLLTLNDYIISCKGEIKGFSLSKSSNIFNSISELNYSGLFVSNHFIILRPRPSILMMYGNSYFLHNILDLLIPIINKSISQNENKKIMPYITIGEIEKYSVLLPGPGFQKKITDFEKVYQSWSDKFELFQEANEELKIFNNELLNEIKVNILEDQ